MKDPLKLANITLSGSRYLDYRNELHSICSIGEEVAIVPEPDNPFDRNALAVKTKNGVSLGYIPEDETSLIIMLIKRKRAFFGKLTEVGYPGEIPIIKIELFLKEI